MSGIAGFAWWNADEPREPVVTVVRRMSAALAHRAPDSEVLYVSPTGTAALASRRPAAGDRSPADHQPMCDPTERYRIVFSGRLRNSRECRNHLAADQYHSRSTCDAEVVLALHALHGHRALEWLRGSFAFAVWDNIEQTLFLARDQLGVKPLYYWLGADSVVFASEVRAIRATGLTSAEADPEALGLFLAWGAVPEPKTIVHRVEALRPGHFMTAGPSGVATRTYWDLAERFTQQEQACGRERAQISQIQRGLQDSLNAQVSNGRSVGLILNSTLESAALLTLMSDDAREKVLAFTMVADRDEEGKRRCAAAKALARLYGTKCREVELSAYALVAGWEQFFAAMDQPTVGGVETYFAARAARECGLEQTLSGDGGAELWGDWTALSSKVRHMNLLLGITRRTKLDRGLRALIALTLPRLVPRLRQALTSELEFEQMYFCVRGVFMRDDVNELLGSLGILMIDPLRYRTRPLIPTPWRTKMLMLEGAGRLTNHVLRDSDAFGAANAVEVNMPYVDPDLSALASSMSNPGNRFQHILAALVRDRLPHEMLVRSRRPFMLPMGRWLRTDAKARVRDSLENLRGLRRPAVARIRDRFFGGAGDWRPIWSLVVLSEFLNISGMCIPADS